MLMIKNNSISIIREGERGRQGEREKDKERERERDGREREREREREVAESHVCDSRVIVVESQ